jgi:hypothetical protein
MIVFSVPKQSPILGSLGMGGGIGSNLISGGSSPFPEGSVQVTISSQANSGWDGGGYGINLQDGTTTTAATYNDSQAPTNGSLFIPNSADRFNTCLQTSTGGMGVGRGSSWGRVDIYFASPINIKFYGSGSGNGGTGSFVEYSGGSTQLITTSTNVNNVVRVYAYHQSGVGGAGITQIARQDGTALFYESGTIDTNRLMAYGS